MRISATVDHGVRALPELAAREAADGAPGERDEIAEAQGIPVHVLEDICPS